MFALVDITLSPSPCGARKNRNWVLENLLLGEHLQVALRCHHLQCVCSCDKLLGLSFAASPGLATHLLLVQLETVVRWHHEKAHAALATTIAEQFRSTERGKYVTMYLNLLVCYLDRARKLVNWTEASISSITDPSQQAALMHLAKYSG